MKKVIVFLFLVCSQIIIASQKPKVPELPTSSLLFTPMDQLTPRPRKPCYTPRPKPSEGSVHNYLHKDPIVEKEDCCKNCSAGCCVCSCILGIILFSCRAEISKIIESVPQSSKNFKMK